MLLFCMIVGIGSAWGQVYTLDATDSKNQGTNNAYADNCDITVNGITWNVTGNATMSPWRIGGKSITNTERMVYSKTAYHSALNKITLEIGNASSIVINSIKLLHSTNEDFSNAETISASNLAANKTYEFAPDGGFPENSYFKFVFNVTVTLTSNKFIEFKKVEFYSDGTTPEQPTKYNVNIDSNISGGTISATPTSAAEGTEITLEATPDDSYQLDSWYVLDGEANEITVTDNKFTMPASDVEVSATFKENIIQKYDITWSVNGSTSTEQYAEGATITVPKVEGIGDYYFVGWVTTSSVDANNTPQYVTPISATANTTYYAVFATALGSAGFYKLIETLTANQTYIFVSSNTVGDAYALDGSKLKVDNANTSSDPKSVSITESNGNKVVTPIDGDLEFKYIKDGEFQVLSSNTNYLLINGDGIGMRGTNYKAYWDNKKGLYGTNSNGNKQYYVQLGQDGFFKANTNSGRVYAYEKTEGDISYSNYCTIIPSEPTTPTFTFKATNNGKDYWATFSSDRVVAFDEAFVNDTETCLAEVKAYFVYAEGDEFILEDLYNDYNDGNYTYIPKNTGVLMKYSLDEDSEEFDGSVPYKYADNVDGYLDEVENNNLYPTSMLMSDVEGDNYFYKLSTFEGKHVGFYWGAEGGGAFAMKNPNGAYLAIPKSAGVKSLSLEDLTTAIERVQSNTLDVNAPVYNIVGQRVNANIKGILIQNGKKYINK